MHRLLAFSLIALGAASACSVINSADDPVEPTGTGGDNTGGSPTGGMGGDGGEGASIPTTCGDGTTDPDEDCDDEGESAT